MLSRTGDNGFTLVELVVGLTVLAVGIGAVVNVFHSSFLVAGQGNNRARAVALATREAESMRAVPYDQLGFAASQAGFASSYEGSETVVVSEPLVEPAGSPAVLGGVTYAFTRHVLWADAASTSGFADAYKRVVVLVSWTDQVGPHTVRQDAFVYPGGQGVYTGPQGGATTTTTALSVVPPSPPLTLSASVPSGTDGATSVNLSWTPSAVTTPTVATWVVEASADAFFSSAVLTDTQPGSLTSYTASGLSPATTYSFRVAARGADGQQSVWSVTALATTTPALSTVCQLGTATLTPSAVKRLHGVTTLLSSNVTATVNTSGTCNGLQIRYAPVAGAVTTDFLLSAAGSVWTGTLNGLTASWDTGTHPVEVLDASGVVLGTMTVTVCVHNAQKCP